MQYTCDHYASLDDIGHFAVALMKLRSDSEQLHAGLFFRDEDDVLKVLHLAFHYDLRLDVPSHKYVWVDVPLDEISKQHLAAACLEVFENNPAGIPYSISRDGASLSESGIFCAEYPYSGLTCSTFVMEFLHSQGFFFVDTGSWLKTPEDKEWQKMIVQALRYHSNAGDQYINDQLKQLEKGVSRFTPEEVCAAAGFPYDSWPVGRFEVKAQAKELKRYVKKHRHNTQH